MLRLSVLFEIAGGKAYAVERLDACPDFSSSQRLMLGLEMQVPGWFERGLRDLIVNPVQRWTPDDIEIIDKELLVKIVGFQELVNRRRQQYALYLPAIQDGCVTCLLQWLEIWARIAIPLLMAPYVSHDVMKTLPDTLAASAAGVCTICQNALFSQLDCWISGEEQLMVKAIEGLVLEYSDDDGL